MIRPAVTSEARALTRISFAAKGYWNYPQEYFEIWQQELTITAEYIRDHEVFVYEEDDRILGYYSIVEIATRIEISGIPIDSGFWLEHMFIEPQYIGFGIGTMLFAHALSHCRARGISDLKVLADPHALGFYEKMGCVYEGEYPSTIGNRTTPYLHLAIAGT